MLLWKEVTWIPLSENLAGTHFRETEAFDANIKDTPVWEPWIVTLSELCGTRKKAFFDGKIKGRTVEVMQKKTEPNMCECDTLDWTPPSPENKGRKPRTSGEDYQ